MDAMIESNIKPSPTVILTGAGASAPLGMQQMSSFMDIVHKTIEPEDYAFLERIYRSARTLDGQPGRDLEVVLERIKQYKDILSVTHSDANLNELSDQGKVARFEEQVSSVDTTIRHLIFSHYGGTIKPRASYELYEALFNKIRSANNPYLPVFTTNYDLAIEEYVEQAKETEVHDGLIQEGNRRIWNPHESFNPREDMSTLKILLFKLHGSVSWYRRDGQIQGFHDVATPSLDGGWESMIIYPAQTKTDTMKEEPYRTLYAFLERYVAQATTFLVIGHSLRDEILLNTIRTALRKNDNISMLIITRTASDQFIERVNGLGAKRYAIIESEFEPGIKASYLRKLEKSIFSKSNIAK